MNGLLIRWALSAASLGIVAWLLPGIVVGDGIGALVSLFLGAALLGLVNVLIKPILVFLSCPLILLTFPVRDQCWQVAVGQPVVLDFWSRILRGWLAVSHRRLHSPDDCQLVPACVPPRKQEKGGCMSSQQILGVVLLLTAIVDVFVGLVVVGPRIANAQSRRLVTLALIAGAGVLGALGIAFLLGAF